MKMLIFSFRNLLFHTTVRKACGTVIYTCACVYAGCVWEPQCIHSVWVQEDGELVGSCISEVLPAHSAECGRVCVTSGSS